MTDKDSGCCDTYYTAKDLMKMMSINDFLSIVDGKRETIDPILGPELTTKDIGHHESQYQSYVTSFYEINELSVDAKAEDVMITESKELDKQSDVVMNLSEKCENRLVLSGDKQSEVVIVGGGGVDQQKDTQKLQEQSLKEVILSHVLSRDLSLPNPEPEQKTKANYNRRAYSTSYLNVLTKPLAPTTTATELATNLKQYSLEKKFPIDPKIPKELRQLIVNALPVLRDNDVKLGKFMGRGGFGVVCEGQLNNKKIALKFHKSDAEFVEKQVNLIRKFNHKNVMTIIEMKTPSFRVTAMPWAVHDLRHHMRRHIEITCSLFSAKHVITLIQDIFNGLHHMHSRGYAHRDLKAANVLMFYSSKSDSFLAKIADFDTVGEAKYRNADGAIVAKPAKCGTYTYWPPEAISGRLVSSQKKTDVWALGIMSYELLTFHRPFPIVDVDSKRSNLKEVRRERHRFFNDELDAVLQDMPNTKQMDANSDDTESVYTANIVEFVRRLLTKDYHLRPSLSDATLRQHPIFDDKTPDRTTHCVRSLIDIRQEFLFSKTKIKRLIERKQSEKQTNK